jgi:putative ABC transport system substrate-binding protein
VKTRRELLSVLGIALASRPLRSLAQEPPKVWRVGILVSRRRPESLETDPYGNVPRGLRERGYIEGRNVVFEWRFAGGDYDKLPGLAADLVKARVDIIVTDGTQSIRAAENATKAIPIVFVGGSDLVARGLVKSMSHPGENATGVALLLSETMGKQLELLSQIAPGLTRVALVFNPANEAHPSLAEEVRRAGLRMNIQVLSFGARTPDEIARAFLSASEEKVQALMWTVDSFMNQQARQFAELAAKHRLPSIAGYWDYALLGGLLNYGSRPAETWKGAVDYIDRILHGANPGDLPIQQPTRLFLVINGKTARELGLTIPPDLLVLADKVIE